jgi:hypothetical protein
MCPVQFAGVGSSGVESPTSDMTVSPLGAGVNVVIDYGAANPLASPVAADINARGEFSLTPTSDTLAIVSSITGDQFPACESFLEDPSGKKRFLGGFAPHGKEQILRLYGLYNPKDILGLARIRGSSGRL